MRVLVLVGSVRAGRFGPVVANWFTRYASTRGGVLVETLDLQGLVPPDPRLATSVRGADAVVIVTPEYNHSFPGPLKSAVDSLRTEWYAKPIGFVSYGGLSGGLRAIEALRLVFAELHAVTVRESVILPRAWELFDGDTPRDPGPLMAAADRMLDQLAWWVVAVTAGREHRAYVG